MSITDRALWYASRQSPQRSCRWSRSELNRLETMVGRLTIAEMAQALGRNANSITSKLQRMGYLIQKDVHEPLGLSAIGLSRRLSVPYEIIWRKVRTGTIPAKRLRTHKDYLIDWPTIRRVEADIRRTQGRRQRALERIKEPTITKQAFMALIGLQETHATRYLQGRIVRAWKIPCQWTDIGRDRWEWVVSKKDARRVKRLRESGRLRLSTKAYRKLQAANNAEITALRRERRLGLRPALGPRQGVIPGWHSVAQLAQQANVSETVVYNHVQLGRLKSKRVKIGQREFIVINPDDVPDYVQWCQREIKATGPLNPRQKQVLAVQRAHRLTISQAAKRYGLNRGSLAAAVSRGHIPSKEISGLRALRARDVRRYAKSFKSRD